jgi:predicted nucleic acid-binding Zn ribbon protein
MQGFRRRLPGLPELRTCNHCGTEFQPIRRNNVFCSLRCRAGFNLKRHRAKYGRGPSGFIPGANLECAYCGNDFIQTSSAQRCCSPRCTRVHATAKWRKANPDFSARRNNAIRVEVFAYYGNGHIACVCCGEDEMKFLTIDHINGGGSEERKALNRTGGLAFYYWLITQNFPIGYQTLCFNCNSAKGLYGECPHQIKQRNIA